MFAPVFSLCGIPVLFLTTYRMSPHSFIYVGLSDMFISYVLQSLRLHLKKGCNYFTNVWRVKIRVFFSYTAHLVQSQFIQQRILSERRKACEKTSFCAMWARQKLNLHVFQFLFFPTACKLELYIFLIPLKCVAKMFVLSLNSFNLSEKRKGWNCTLWL